ncbi:protein C3orf33 homolog [Trichomycterus rosablanca]|uniref:protein C3orf33 homolog n=1 Tax=Trichomycterus rosablanca TaxID=2290929 RepID=UPI002F35B84D
MPDYKSVDQQEKEEKQAVNVITGVSRFADEHLTLIRNISTGLAVAGVIIIARSIRLVSTFSSVSEIPAHFIERNVSIRGRVRSVTDRGLEVEHVPIYVPLLSRLLSKRQAVTPLRVGLAGVDLTPQGRDWLVQRLRTDETVWLRLIGRQNDHLHCLVSLGGGSVFKLCVNEEILRLGLGRTAPLHGLDPRSRLHWRLHARLLKCERRAERGARGIWEEESLRERVRRGFRENAVVRAMKRVLKWMMRMRDQ